MSRRLMMPGMTTRSCSMSVGEVAEAWNPENPTKNFPHGMPTTEVETINADLPIKGQRNRGTGAPAPTPSGANTYRSALAPGASGAKAESARENVPSVRLDLSKTGMCGVMSFSLTSQARLSAEP
jgi:hypothetical protein